MLPNCGTVKQDEHIDVRTKISKAFSEHVANFEHICDMKVNAITIKFGNTGKSRIGYCRLSIDTPEKEIVIQRDYWDKASYNEREVLVFHELGHCILDRDHDNTFIIKDNKSIPKSIMKSNNIGLLVSYETYKTYYHKELCE